MLDDLTELAALIGNAKPKRKAPNQPKPSAHKPKGTQSAEPSIDPSKLQRILTSDPWETLGVELHVSVVTCQHCGNVYRSPLAGTNTLTRRVQKRTAYRTPHERIVNGPVPWISTSIPQDEKDFESWRNEIPMDWANGFETVEHHGTCVRCEACTTEATIPNQTGQLRLGSNKPLEGIKR